MTSSRLIRQLIILSKLSAHSNKKTLILIILVLVKFSSGCKVLLNLENRISLDVKLSIRKLVKIENKELHKLRSVLPTVSSSSKMLKRNSTKITKMKLRAFRSGKRNKMPKNVRNTERSLMMMKLKTQPIKNPLLCLNSFLRNTLKNSMKTILKFTSQMR